MADIDVEAVAHLARITIDSEQVPVISEQMQDIFGLFTQLQEVDTKGVAPMAHPLDAVQRERADEVTAENERDLFQQTAPAAAEGLYLVPKVVDNA